ncbi:winged helix-turn-helix domain-containing protein [Arcobacter sp. LA11]|uniref:winged helix-turn-helix domain-containing protein n=1 Tax=Arcobacter sp. LA11 TaxID=1898176 RepID=UPI000933E7F6|nr:winged helix-turn-helix domain-containing protein [Arcobacter sp. LA11]
MSQDITITLSKEMELFLSKKAKKKEIPLKNTIEELINEQINNKIHFDEGFYFDKLKNKLFKADGRIIEFTKLQSGLFHLLLEKHGEIVSFETIHNEVWKNKKMSIFTMRNVVKRIRDLTYYGIIVNHSNLGYSLGETKD